MREKVESLWAKLKQRREEEKAPPELTPYFKCLNATKLHPEDVEDAVAKLDEILEDYPDLRIYLDRTFDPSCTDYDSLPQRVNTTFAPWKPPVVQPPVIPVDASEVFPNGLGRRKSVEQKAWMSRMVPITKKMIIAKVLQEYRHSPQSISDVMPCVFDTGKQKGMSAVVVSSASGVTPVVPTAPKRTAKEILAHIAERKAKAIEATVTVPKQYGGWGHSIS